MPYLARVLGCFLWNLGDHQHSTRHVVDYDEFADATTVVNDIDYDSFGRIVGQSGWPLPLSAWTGRYRDPDTGLQWNRARWYDPETRQWLSEDPIGFTAGDANLSRYVGNSPTNWTDPDGLFQRGGRRRGRSSARPPSASRPGSSARYREPVPFPFRNWREYEFYEQECQRRGIPNPRLDEVRRQRRDILRRANLARGQSPGLRQAIRDAIDAGVPPSRIAEILNPNRTFISSGRINPTNIRIKELNRAAAYWRRTQEHHSDPRFMGGDPNQPRTTMSAPRHDQLHRDLLEFLRNKTDGRGHDMCPRPGNSGRTIRRNFSRQERLEAMAEFYKKYRNEYPDAARDFFGQHPHLE